MKELPSDRQRETVIAIGGAFSNRGDRVEPGLPEVWQAAGKVNCRNRLELAQWLVSESNPLTPRVMVNRVWEQLLGVPLVASLDDFGTQGVPPANARLLDWMADDFRRNGWSLKLLCKQIVLSATYQQSSKVLPASLDADPGNLILGRASRYRLSAEQIRDYALTVSGLLSRKMYGPPVRPPQPKLGLNAAFGGSLDWEPSEGEDRYRRAVYTLLRRTNLYPSFMALDATSRTVCTVQRTRTNTPITSFVTLNDPVFVECAQALGRQTVEQSISEAEATTGPSATNQWAEYFQKIVCRIPTTQELTWVEMFWHEQVTGFQADSTAALAICGLPQADVSQFSESDRRRVAQQAAWVVLANSLLNLDEVLTRN